ncbi:flagellin [Oceanicoccus sp. KOV_DT_Chl]|uniref:flagellin N-terminal helical domain-containing protein n=1 Tax=Oceanicoccus sp. KOV_DT_Chl TaxID=1904639 RepID=UPI000C7AA5B8|nr:flagellin [Oceanicoccus sp. KOV_DT_Chl]
MVQSINNNGLSSGLLQGLNRAQSTQETALERISSGKKVNSAADNAAGLAIIERFASQIDGAGQAIRNTSDGISFSQVAESGIGSISEDIQRIRELSIQAANGSLSDSDRSNLQSEVGQLQDEISRRLDQTSFNGVDIFKTDAEISFQVGANANDTIELSTKDLSADLAAVVDIDISTQAGAQDALANIDPALDALNDQRVDFGAVANRFESTIDNLQNNRINTQAARSRVEDADLAKETSELIKGNIQQQSGIAVQAQANTNAELILRLLS